MTPGRPFLLTQPVDRTTLFVVPLMQRRQVIVFFMPSIALLAGLGCATKSFWPFGPSKSVHETGRATNITSDNPFLRGQDAPSSGGIRIVDIAFDVMRAELPLAGVRDSRKIWNHIDQVRVTPEQAVLLARNGLRIGATSPDSWSAIQTILDAAGGKISSETVFPQRGAALPIALGRIEDDESIFHYGGDGRLVGKTFPAGDRILVVDYAVRPELDGCVDIGVSFEITHETGQTVWENHDGVLQQSPAMERHRFDALTSMLTLHPGEFIVIGQSDDIKNDYVVGSRYLSFRRSGERMETVLFISPRPYQSQSARRESQ